VMQDMPRPRPRHLHSEIDRHGNRRWYVRMGKGRRIRVAGEYGSPDFTAAYEAALADLQGHGAKKIAAATKTATLEWLIRQYETSSEWIGLAEATKRHRRTTFAIVCRSAGDKPFRLITQETIRAGLDRRASSPHVAANFLKAMRGLFKWADDRGYVSVDPTAGVKRPRIPKSDGFHIWTLEECARFESRWPLGTPERLAFDVLLYTGFRRADAVRLGRQHIRDGEIWFRTSKTSAPLVLPLLPPLARSIEATPIKGLTFIETEAGRPRDAAAFGNWFRDACTAAGAPGAAHGLRKAGASRAAENGATEHQLMALYGWKKIETAATYTRAANRATMARAAGNLLLIGQDRNTLFPHLESGEGKTTKKASKINDGK
jgi:integrase